MGLPPESWGSQAQCHSHVLAGRPWAGDTTSPNLIPPAPYPATKMRGMSAAKASPISRLPTLAMQCKARHMKVGLRLARSFLMALLMSRISSELEFTSTEMKR